jgi:predicted secreted protein
MSITAALVVFAVTWFMVFFLVLQWRPASQADSGSVVPGTPPGAPAAETVKRKALVTTGIATVIWAVIVSIILWGGISVRDLDWAGRMPPLPAADERGE